VPREERASLPLIVMGREVLWAIGLRLSEGHKPVENTKKYLYIKVEKA
ncbi:MAG: tRNA(Ile)-lysidine synthetase, partial [Anaerotignum sp.]|nr:tRNA(Ile)-lysidine synthetase [Anaerotignum sp.]